MQRRTPMILASFILLSGSVAAHAQQNPFENQMDGLYQEYTPARPARDNEQLQRFQIGQGTGRTAAEHGLSEIFHETRTLELFKAMTVESAKTAPIFTTSHHEGEYFVAGNPHLNSVYGPHHSGYITTAKLAPTAREFTDFDLTTDKTGRIYVLVKNRDAVILDDESFRPSVDLKMALDLLKKIFSNEKLEFNQRGQYKQIRQALTHYWENDPKVEQMLTLLAQARNQARDSFVAATAAKWIYLPFMAAREVISEKDRFLAQKLLESYKKDPSLARCEEATLIVDFLLQGQQYYWPENETYLTLLKLPPDHLCTPFFANFWIDKAYAFMSGAPMSPSREKIIEARRQAGSLQASAALLLAIHTHAGVGHWFDRQNMRAIAQPIFSTSADHPYRHYLRNLWSSLFSVLFPTQNPEAVVREIGESDLLPRDEMVELFMEMRPEVDDPNEPPDTWKRKANLVAHFVANQLSGDAQLTMLDGLIRALQKQKEEEWTPDTIRDLRIKLLKSELATSIFIDRLLPFINFRSKPHLFALLDPSLVPEGAGPTWELQVRGFIRKAKKLGEGPCNAALQ